MDDSVIKVLRRNGSWTKANNFGNQEKSNTERLKKTDEDFSLDKNFGILAEEIKKRMMFKKKNKVTSDTKISKKNDMTMDAKKELLPLLKNIEVLTEQREEYSKQIMLIDEELEKVKNNIINIKQTYENNIEQLKNNINFFEESISLINNIKGEK